MIRRAYVSGDGIEVYTSLGLLALCVSASVSSRGDCVEVIGWDPPCRYTEYDYDDPEIDDIEFTACNEYRDIDIKELSQADYKRCEEAACNWVLNKANCCDYDCEEDQQDQDYD